MTWQGSRELNAPITCVKKPIKKIVYEESTSIPYNYGHASKKARL
jgi:hypothetical protein